jgi:anti-sigma factor RsiW
MDHTCKDEVALIADYLRAMLKPHVLAVFEQHLAQCPDCAAFLKTYKTIVELTASSQSIPFVKRCPCP